MYFVIEAGRKEVTKINPIKKDSKNVDVMKLVEGDMVRVKDKGIWVGPLEVIEVDEAGQRVKLLA